MKTFFFIILLSLNAFSALTIEDLKKTFLTDRDLGPMSYEKLIELEDALIDIGRDDILMRLLDKLDRSQISFLSSIVHVCKLEGDVLGTYQRGATHTQMSTLSPDKDYNDLRVFWERADLLDTINSAYRYQILNNGVYASLVVMEWPVICIRPGKMLANNLATFAHEVEHFLGDKEEKINIKEYKDEEDFVVQTLYKSGGEFDAYQAGARLYHNLKVEVGYQTPQSFMQFFDHEGIVIDPMGLEKFILDELDYRESFEAQYRSNVVESYNEKITNYNQLVEWFNLYESNLKINEHNIGVYENNIKVYEYNKNLYERRGDNTKAQEMAEKLAQTKKDLQKARAGVNFYQNIIELKVQTLDEVQKDMTIIQDMLLRLRRSQMSDNLND